MTKIKAIIFCLAVVVSTLPALASGGGGGAITPPRPGAGDAFAPTKALRATVIKADAEKNTLTVKDPKDREITLKLSKKTKYRAEDAQDFGGRKDLTVQDLAANASIRILYQDVDQTVVEVKVLKKQ